MIVSISVEDSIWDEIPGLEELAERAVSAVGSAELHSPTECEVSILFTSDAKIETMNKTWRGKAKPANVLSFPAPPGQPTPEGEPKFLGDIVLASGIVAQEAASQGKDIKFHTAHLIVHGLMHLLGHDHQSDAEAELMEAKEIRILRGLGIPDPYAGGKLL
jgi:probable rRNA maturation factor